MEERLNIFKEDTHLIFYFFRLQHVKQLLKFAIGLKEYEPLFGLLMSWIK